MASVRGSRTERGDDLARRARQPGAGTPVAEPAPRRLPLWRRLLGQRPEPTTYQRCLAVHLYVATKPSALK